MQRIVINRGIGGFGLNQKAYLKLLELGHPCATEKQEQDKWEIANHPDLHTTENPEIDGFLFHIPRNDKTLLHLIDEWGIEQVQGPCSRLVVVEIPDDVIWGIGETDEGFEWVYEQHRVWISNESMLKPTGFALNDTRRNNVL